MTTHKTLKRRVRARAAKTGESYTAARAQLVPRGERTQASGEPEPEAELDVRALAGVSDEAIIRGSAKPLAAWIQLLDGWNATARTHTEIARWLVAEQAVPGWYAQTITVAYERARGIRALHEQRSGFSVSATRTVAAPAERALAAFTDPGLRARWLPDAPMRQRRTTAANVARFDWGDPASRVVVGIVPKEAGRCQVAVAHEKLPTAEQAERIKSGWREALGRLKELLETG